MKKLEIILVLMTTKSTETKRYLLERVNASWNLKDNIIRICAENNLNAEEGYIEQIVTGVVSHESYTYHSYDDELNGTQATFIANSVQTWDE